MIGIGFIILGLIAAPLFVLMVASILDTPRSARVAAMFTSAFLLQVVAMLLGFVVLAFVLGFFVPKG